MLSDSLEILLELDANRESYATRTLGTGKPPGVSDTVNQVLNARGADAAIETFKTLRTTRPPIFDLPPVSSTSSVISSPSEERSATR